MRINSSLVSDIYVGNDGKLHKTKGGADTVLNFSGSASYPEFTLYSNSSITIPVKGNTLSFDMQTLHPYVNFYVDKRVNETYTNLFTQKSGGNYTGTKSFDISDSDAIRFRTAPFDSAGNYANVGNVAVSNIKVS